MSIPINTTHPAIKKGELLLFHCTNETWNKVRWRTKRKGPAVNNQFPVFVEAWEVLTVGFAIRHVKVEDVPCLS